MNTRSLGLWTTGIALLMVSLLCPAESQANTITIDFDNAVPGTYGSIAPPPPTDYVEDGFRMTLVSNHYDFYSGLLQLDTYSQPNGMTSVRFDRFGDTFDFESVTILSWLVQQDPAYATVIPFITSSSGGFWNIMETTSPQLLTFSSAAWKDISWIDFSILSIDPFGVDQSNLLIDDVVFNVPEPSTSLLLGIGLCGLALATRKVGLYPR